MTDTITDVDKQNFLKQRLKKVGGVYIQEDINKSGHDKCMKRVGGIDREELIFTLSLKQENRDSVKLSSRSKCTSDKGKHFFTKYGN